MEFDMLYEYIRDIAKSKDELKALEKIISTPDAGRISGLTPRVIKAGVYIPNKDKLLKSIEHDADSYILVITGDNGDGKTLLLKSLSVLLSDKNARYVMITEDFDITDGRLFIDGIDESIEVDEEGNLNFREDVGNKIRRIVSLFTSGRIKGPVFATTLGAYMVLRDIGTDLHRRTKEIVKLRKERPRAFDFVLKRDIAYFYVLKEPNPDKAFGTYRMLREELSGIIEDVNMRRVSDVNRLYYDALLHASEDSSKPITENIRNAPSKYHKEFEENSIEILQEIVNSLKGLLDLDIRIRPMGGINEPDAEIIVLSKEGETRIAFDAKFVKGDFSEPVYTRNYPYTLYFVASLSRIDREDVFRLPYSLGYILAVDPLEAEYFIRYFGGLKYKILNALRSASKSAEKVVDAKLLKVLECLEKLVEAQRSEKEKRYKMFKKSKIKKVCSGVEPDEFIEFVNTYCEGLIEKRARGRYSFTRDPRECIEKMKKLL